MVGGFRKAGSLGAETRCTQIRHPAALDRLLPTLAGREFSRCGPSEKSAASTVESLNELGLGLFSIGGVAKAPRCNAA